MTDAGDAPNAEALRLCERRCRPRTRSMPMIRIHDFARGARGLRVGWQCEEMGLPYRFETVSFPPSAAYRALNPLGSVPFLQDDAGVAINESIAMMLYLAQRYGPTPLLPGKDDPTLGRVLQMTVFGEAAIGAEMNSLLAAHFAAPEADKRNWSVRRRRASSGPSLMRRTCWATVRVSPAPTSPSPTSQ
jgi:glutathione S-transferase